MFRNVGDASCWREPTAAAVRPVQPPGDPHWYQGFSIKGSESLIQLQGVSIKGSESLIQLQGVSIKGSIKGSESLIHLEDMDSDPMVEEIMDSDPMVGPHDRWTRMPTRDILPQPRLKFLSCRARRICERDGDGQTP